MMRVDRSPKIRLEMKINLAIMPVRMTGSRLTLKEMASKRLKRRLSRLKALKMRMTQTMMRIQVARRINSSNSPLTRITSSVNLTCFKRALFLTNISSKCVHLHKGILTHSSLMLRRFQTLEVIHRLLGLLVTVHIRLVLFQPSLRCQAHQDTHHQAMDLSLLDLMTCLIPIQGAIFTILHHQWQLKDPMLLSTSKW